MNRFILWLLSRCQHYGRMNIIDFQGKTVANRWCPFWFDEWTGSDGKKHNRPPWYRPFNILLHRWVTGDRDLSVMHDHPRWSITILLRGKIIEHTPWEKKVLTPGSVVIRGRKYIHTIEVPPEYRGKTWTLFIVGRRNYLQHYLNVVNYDKEY